MWFNLGECMEGTHTEFMKTLCDDCKLLDRAAGLRPHRRNSTPIQAPANEGRPKIQRSSSYESILKDPDSKQSASWLSAQIRSFHRWINSSTMSDDEVQKQFKGDREGDLIEPEKDGGGMFDMFPVQDSPLEAMTYEMASGRRIEYFG